VFRHQCPCRRPQNPPGWNNLALSPGCSQLSPLGTVLMNWLVAVVSWLGTISYNWASRRLPFGMTLTLAPRSQRAWSSLWSNRACDHRAPWILLLFWKMIEYSCSTLLLMVYMCIKLRLDLQADKSSVIAKGPLFPQVWT
jgi:hypothetical protein